MKDWSFTFTVQDVEVRQRTTMYEGFFEVQELKIRHRLFEGGWSKPLSRELFVRNPAVGVLLYDPQADIVVLLEQFRVGALEEQTGPWQLELVAGIVEDGEGAEQVAGREAREEAGCVPSLLMPMFEYLVSPGGSNEKMTLYCGIVDSAGLQGIHGLQQEGEDIRLHKLKFASALQEINGGYINNAATIMAIQWLELNKPSVLETWNQQAEP